MEKTMTQKLIQVIPKEPDYETLITLIEYMVYYKMSYPTGVKDTCEIFVDDKIGSIFTPLKEYKIADQLFIKLHLLSN